MDECSREKKTQAFALIESIPWGDLELGIQGFEQALQLALEATTGCFLLWEAEGEERYDDEFSLAPEQVAELDDEWRLAYVARLLVSMAFSYGVGTGVYHAKRPITLIENNHSPAALLRGLNDILWGVPPLSATTSSGLP